MVQGCSAIHTPSWLDVAAYLADDSSLEHRTASVNRVTKETAISIELDLDGTGEGHITTGAGFLDHMLDQLVRHSRIETICWTSLYVTRGLIWKGA